MAEAAASEPRPERYNAAVDLLERNLVTGRRERPYLLVRDRRYSYEEVATAADAAYPRLVRLHDRVPSGA